MKKKVVHRWDGETFNNKGLPVAECDNRFALYPRATEHFLTTEELKTLKRCGRCLRLPDVDNN